MEIGEFIQEMERLASPDLADEMDEGRIGLIVEGKTQIKNICCALDATPEVVRRSVEAGADMLVVHHTPIWNPITAIRDPLASLLREAMASGLNIYVMHTNFDRAASGVNDTIADMLGLTGRRSMSLGIVGECGLSLEEISRRLSCPLRAWGEIVPPFSLAVVGGSGFYPDLIEEARALSARAFLSSELKHSVMRQSPLVLIEATHYALEAPAMRVLAERNGWRYIDDRPFLKTWT